MKIWRCGLLAAITMMLFMGMGMTSMGSVMRYNQTTKEWEELCLFNIETKRIKVIG